MSHSLPPASILVLGAFILPFCKGKWKKAFLLLLPVISFVNLISIPQGYSFAFNFLDYRIILARVDRLSLVFGYIFHIISFIALLYALHVDNDTEHIASLVYGGCAIGAVFSGDLLSFFLFWEMLTISSVFLIWSRQTPSALASGYRYLLVHAAGGLCLLAGILVHISQTGSMAFGYLGLHDIATLLIFLGLGVNCAWPILHPWLTDSYPEATITGTIFLSAFTTKTAVYALARAFPGESALIWIGAIMTAFPIFYAVIENDLRRVLSYSLINQVGFMVCGIGIGTQLAINGAVSHAFNDILFKALLFMSIGAVMYRTGRVNATDLGGLYKTMPLTCIFCMIGAASISAFPLFSGFVSKSMVMEAAVHGNLRIIWFILLFASAGVFHHAGIKIPFFAFFSHDSGIRTKEAPLNMLLAMGLAAGLCIFIGSFPGPLYSLLPYHTEYIPYTSSHVLGQTQLLFFSSLAFTLLILSGIYPSEMRAVNLDFDWFYRKGGNLVLVFSARLLNGLNDYLERAFVSGLASNLAKYSKDGLARAMLIPMVSLWIIAGKKGERLEIKKRNLYNDMVKGTLPIGIGTGIAALFIILLFLLS